MRRSVDPNISSFLKSEEVANPPADLCEFNVWNFGAPDDDMLLLAPQALGSSW